MQRDKQWWRDKLGIASASCFGQVLAKGKSGEAATRRDYRFQLSVERLTGVRVSGFSSTATDWGTSHEDEAREAFELETGLMVEQVDFIRHPVTLAGCSPDGLIGTDAGLEIKCPYNSAIHLESVLNGMPPKHKPQVQGGMWVTGRDRWWFVSYDPRMPPEFRLYRQIINRDDKYIGNLEEEVIKFNAEVDKLLNDLQTRMREMGNGL